MTTPGPLLRDTDQHNGERVIARADIDTESTPKGIANELLFGAICASIIMPPCIPLICTICSPCGAEERIHRRLIGSRLVLTESAVHYEIDEHDCIQCCGCMSSAKETKTVPLTNITDIQVINQSRCCCCNSYPMFSIYTANDKWVEMPQAGWQHHHSQGQNRPQRQAAIQCPGVTNGDELCTAIWAQCKHQDAPVGQISMGAPV